MASANTAVLHGWHHVDDAEAKIEIAEACGDLSGVRIRDDQILTAVYMRPAKYGKSGLLTVRETQREDVYQGKVSLVLKVGPSAFKGRNQDINVGDWIVSPVRLCEQISIRCPGSKIREDRAESGWLKNEGWPARVLFEKDILMVIERPEWIV
jgi:hypothetical protein